MLHQLIMLLVIPLQVFLHCSLISYICFSRTWILDSDITHHITPYIHFVHNAKPVNSEIHLSNDDLCTVSHIGDIHLSKDIHLFEVLVVPTF